VTALLDSGKTEFLYEELQELAGCDIRSGRGRGQFYRFRRELLSEKQLWMECVPGKGYAIIAAKDHPSSALRRVKYARRKLTMARAINGNVRIEDMTPEERATQAATAAVLYHLSQQFGQVSKNLKIASEQAKLSDTIDLPKLLKSINT
jgi:hypothetical protein